MCIEKIAHIINMHVMYSSSVKLNLGVGVWEFFHALLLVAAIGGGG